MAGLSGKNLRFDFGSGPTHMKVDRCRSTFKTQLVESTNSESHDAGNNYGVSEFVFGVKDADIDIDVIYQISDGIYTIIGDGVSGTATFYPDKGTVGTNVAGTLMIETFELTGEERGLMKAHITGKFTLGATKTAL